MMARLAVTTSLTLALSGCAFFRVNDSFLYERPLVAVVSFENRVRFPLDWQLGDGIAEILADALYRSGRFRVLDRGDLDDVLLEQELQATGKTREEESVATGRLRNAHYLIKGVITEFTHVSVSGIDLGIGSLRIGGGGNHAIVNLVLKVTEVESGEIVYTRVAEGNAYAGDIEFRATYDNIALGGRRFYQTPLGAALREALDEAVGGIEDSIGRRPWRPTISSVAGDEIIMSGGRDRRVRVDSRWLVRGGRKSIVDPRTGDVLGSEPGRLIGTLRVSRVEERYSVARPEDGEGFECGQRLEPAPNASP